MKLLLLSVALCVTGALAGSSMEGLVQILSKYLKADAKYLSYLQVGSCRYEFDTKPGKNGNGGSAVNGYFTEAQCRRTCVDNRNCVGVSYTGNAGRCKIHTNVNDLYGTNDAATALGRLRRPAGCAKELERINLMKELDEALLDLDAKTNGVLQKAACTNMNVIITPGYHGTGGIGCHSCNSQEACKQFCFSRTQCVGVAWSSAPNPNGAQCITYFKTSDRDGRVAGSQWTLISVDRRPAECKNALDTKKRIPGKELDSKTPAGPVTASARKINLEKELDDVVLLMYEKTHGVLTNPACTHMPVTTFYGQRGSGGIGCYACNTEDSCKQFCFARTQCVGAAWSNTPNNSGGSQCYIYFNTSDRDNRVMDSKWTLAAIFQRPAVCT